MKRAALKRTGGLRRTSNLKRSGQLPRRTAGLRRTPLARQSAKAKARSRARAACMAVVALRSGGRCELRIPGVCTRWASDGHEPLPRSGGGNAFKGATFVQENHTHHHTHREMGKIADPDPKLEGNPDPTAQRLAETREQRVQRLAAEVDREFEENGNRNR